MREYSGTACAYRDASSGLQCGYFSGRKKEIKYVVLWTLELFFFCFYENLSGVLQGNVKTNLE